MNNDQSIKSVGDAIFLKMASDAAERQLMINRQKEKDKMSASREDIIKTASKEIIDNFGIWEAEAHQQCQMDQSGDFYDVHMMECVSDVISKALRDEAWRTNQHD